MEPVYHKKRPKNVIEKRPRQVQYQFSRAENKSVAAADGSLGKTMFQTANSPAGFVRSNITR